MVITHHRTNRYQARITRQGQITVPKALRDQLGAQAGDILVFEPAEEGFVLRHLPRDGILSLAGIARSAARRIPTTAAGIDAAVAAGMEASARTSTERPNRQARSRSP